MARSKQNFFKDHYDWLVATIGVAALVGVGFLFCMAEGDPQGTALAECEAKLNAARASAEREAKARASSSDTKVYDMSELTNVLSKMTSPDLLKSASGDGKGPSYLVSECRVYCQKCQKPIPFKSKKCPFCDENQEFEKPVDVIRHGNDSDNDGMTDAWETKYGLNPNDPNDAGKDADGDTFTNLEEFTAKTDPTNPEDHPDFLGDLKIAGNFKEVLLPFWFKVAHQIPGSYRLRFDVRDVNRYEKAEAIVGKEVVFSVKNVKYEKGVPVGPLEIGSGWRVAEYNERFDMVDRKGSEQKIRQDVSTVVLERIKDKRKITIPLGNKPVPIDTQIDLEWSRDGGKTITVSTGSEFSLGKGKDGKGRTERKYKVKKITKDSVTVIDLKTKAEKILR